MITGLAALFMLAAMSQSVTHAAVQVEGLYEIEIPVASQGRSERKRALRRGLADIFTRLTGSQGLEQFGQMLNVLDRAARYVEQYRYHKRAVTGTGGPGQKPEWMLWVRFNRKAIQKLLQDQELPLWGSTRPETLVWLAVEDKGERYILGNDTDNPYYHSIVTQANRRAVPILFPLMDLEDQQKVGVADVWGEFTEPVRDASIRYATENVLIGKIFPVQDGRWESSWALISSAGEQYWSGQGEEIGQAIAAGFDGLADIMISRYALKGSRQTASYKLKITHIDSLQDYAKTNRYLTSVSRITRFQPDTISQGYVLYSIDLRGTVDALRQVFALEQILVPDGTHLLTSEDEKKPLATPVIKDQVVPVTPAGIPGYRLKS